MKLICNYYIGNYGSVLQSTASFIALKKIDPDIKVIRYIPSVSRKAKIEIDFRVRLKYIFNTKMLKSKVNKVLFGKSGFGNDIMERRSARFKIFTENYLSFTQEYKNEMQIAADFKDQEVLVIGSDQLWGPEDIIKDYHTLTWVPTGVRKVSYATSFGVSELPHYLYKRTRRFLNRMDSISVREEQGVDIVSELSDNTAVQVCDPTLLLTPEEWEQIIPKTDNKIGKYIFCFFIGDNPEQRVFAKKMKEITGYSLVAIQHLDKYIESDEGFADMVFNDASPDEFVNLIRNAEYIVCDSFHAMIFSVLNRKRFILFNRYAENEVGSRNSRIDSICRKLNITDRRCSDAANPNEWIDKNIDFDSVFKLIDMWREESKSYIEHAIK